MEETKRFERCFWCGKLKDSTIEETEETLKNSVITNYIPCDDCKKVFSEGIHVIGVTEKPIVKGMFPITKGDKNPLYPTGSMFVANETFIKNMLADPSEKELLDNVLEERVLLLPDEFVTDIVQQARKENGESEFGKHINELENIASNE